MRSDKYGYSKINPLRLAEVLIILSILVSGFILFAYERKNHDPDYNKNWVAFYFANANLPEQGVVVENHTGENTDFQFCLVPDSDNLMEPQDLSCNVNTVEQSVTKNITAGTVYNWNFPAPEKKGKYWIVLEYKDKDVLKKKDLSFTLVQ